MKLMPNCRDVARAVSTDELDELPLRRRLLMRWHLFVCGDCANYARQIEAISRAARELDLDLGLGPDVEPDDLESLEARILDELSD